MSQNPEVLCEKADESVREKAEEERRPTSPFPKIPDVSVEGNVVEEDVAQFQKKAPLKSPLRPESPFPTIPDVSLTPDIVEKDITLMRTSPLPFLRSENDAPPTETSEKKCYTTSAPLEPTIPFPEIPAQIEETRSSTSLFRPPQRKFEPVSMTGKKYTINEPKIQTTPAIKPEYNFALADIEHKIVERAYSEGTASNIRSLQSEIFESQGHFNASRSCSPFPVYIPLSREATPVLKEPILPPTTQGQVKVDVNDAIQVPHVETRAERHLRESTIGGDENVSQVVKSQQKCFSELRDIQFCYAAPPAHMAQVERKPRKVPIEAVSEETEIQRHLKEMKAVREGKCGEITQTVTAEESSNFSTSAAGKTNNVITTEASNQDTTTTTTLFQSKAEPRKQSTVEDEPKIPELLCKKPPDAIIGARPLFGQLDITSEFKKAIVGRSKSLQSRRSRNETKQIEKSTNEPTVKIGRCQNVETEDVTEDSKVSTQMKDTTTAEVTKIESNEHEEIEKIYFQQEREYQVDIQTTRDDFDLSSALQGLTKGDSVEYFGPSSYSVVDTRDLASSKVNGIARSSRVSANLNAHRETYSESLEYAQGEEEYHKVPVKSLIKNFEQCSMPAMRYKKIRDPLPDVVEKLSGGRLQSNETRYETSSTLYNPKSESVGQDISLRKAEEEFNHLFYISNSSVRSQPYFPQLEIQHFQQSENSSFCKYSSRSNLSQDIPQSASQNVGQSTMVEATHKGKLLLYVFLPLPLHACVVTTNIDLDVDFWTTLYPSMSKGPKIEIVINAVQEPPYGQKTNDQNKVGHDCLLKPVNRFQRERSLQQ